MFPLIFSRTPPLSLQPRFGFWICDSHSSLLSLKARQPSGSWICDLDPCPVILTRATQALDSGFWIHRLSAHPQSPRLDFGFWISNACSDPQNRELDSGSWILGFTTSSPEAILDLGSWIPALGQIFCPVYRSGRRCVVRCAVTYWVDGAGRQRGRGRQQRGREHSSDES